MKNKFHSFHPYGQNPDYATAHLYPRHPPYAGNYISTFASLPRQACHAITSTHRCCRASPLPHPPPFIRSVVIELLGRCETCFYLYFSCRCVCVGVCEWLGADNKEHVEHTHGTCDACDEIMVNMLESSAWTLSAHLPRRCHYSSVHFIMHQLRTHRGDAFANGLYDWLVFSPGIRCECDGRPKTQREDAYKRMIL